MQKLLTNGNIPNPKDLETKQTNNFQKAIILLTIQQTPPSHAQIPSSTRKLQSPKKHYTSLVP